MSALFEAGQGRPWSTADAQERGKYFDIAWAAMLLADREMIEMEETSE